MRSPLVSSIHRPERKIPTLVLRSPVQSPTTGWSPTWPNVPALSILGSHARLPSISRANEESLGRYIPIFIFPSPVQSPTIGMSPSLPKEPDGSAPASHFILPFVSSAHSPAPGRKIPTLVV